MKKNYKTKKTTRLLILLTIMSLMLFGCGSTQAESTTEPEKQEPEVVEEVETTVEETPTVQEKPEITEETEKTTEPSETEETVVEDPGEVEYITDYLTLWEYTATIDPSELHILIYNEADRYIIDMKEGQHYQLKSEDKIYTMLENGNTIGYGYNHDIITGYRGEENAPEQELIIDYSKMTENQEFFIDHKLDNGEIIQLTVYLDPPTN